MNTRILFVDDDINFLQGIQSLYRKKYEIDVASDPDQAAKLVQNSTAYAVIVADMRMPGLNGIQLLEKIAKINPKIIRIMLTGYADLETAVSAVNQCGIFRLLTKPCNSQTLSKALDAALASYHFKHSNSSKTGCNTSHNSKLGNLVGEGPSILEMKQTIQKLGSVDITVLITGESGTGKEVVAEALHSTGGGSMGPFIRVNCPALSENLFESELFGHVRGAFTGAIKDRKGRFDVANNGTIFLDEIADIPGHIQAKLLRVLERKEFERVGDTTTVYSNARIIAATNKDLQSLSEKRLFREDLFYRLSAMHIKLPPLCERREDIYLLAKHFLDAANKRYQKNITGISEEVLKVFQNYNWPGNIRELKHVVECAVVFCSTHEIKTQDISLLLGRDHLMSALKVKNSYESREELLHLLEKTGWNKAKTARKMGVSRSTLYRYMKKMEIDTTE